MDTIMPRKNGTNKLRKWITSRKALGILIENYKTLSKTKIF